jgi:hypothetical protein
MLEALKKGLKILQTQVKSRKDALQARLEERKSISSEDERWLDHDANLVDEQQVLDTLEEVSDYERGVGKLNDAQKGALGRLREVVGDIVKSVGKKRKNMCIYGASIQCLSLMKECRS